MESCSPCQLTSGKRAWKMYLVYVALVLWAVVVVLAVALPTMLCKAAAGSAMVGNGSAGLERLEEALANTSQSLAEAHRQWDVCRKELGELEGKASELEQALARVTQLQEENGKLEAEVAQQQEQLKDLQSSRDQLQLQKQLLQKELQDMRSQHSGGNGLPAVYFSLLALLPAVLLL